MKIESLSDEARQAAFEAMVAMAWADAHLTREEVFAVRAAGELLTTPYPYVGAGEMR